MSKYNNSAKIFTGSTGGELRISLKDTRQTITAHTTLPKVVIFE